VTSSATSTIDGLTAPGRSCGRWGVLQRRAVGFLAWGFEDKQLAGLEAADAVLVARVFKILPEPEQARLFVARPTIDLDPTDVEV